VGVRRRVGVVGTLLQSTEDRAVGESKGFGFSPSLSPGFGVVSPLGIQNLSINRIGSGTVVVGRRDGMQWRERRNGNIGWIHRSTFKLSLSLPFRIPAIPEPTRNPRRIDCPVVRSPSLSVCTRNEGQDPSAGFEGTYR